MDHRTHGWIAATLAGALIWVPTAALAQREPPAGTPLEMKKLEFLVGRWKNPSTGGTSLSLENAWLLRGRYLQMRSHYKTKGMDARQTLGILGYDPQRKQYRFWVFSPTDPVPNECAGEFTGGQLVLVGQQREPNVEVRLTFKPRSRTAFQFRSEVRQGEAYVKEQEALLTIDR